MWINDTCHGESSCLDSSRAICHSFNEPGPVNILKKRHKQAMAHRFIVDLPNLKW